MFCAGTGVAADASGLCETVQNRQRNDPCPPLPETIQDAASGPERAELLRLLGSRGRKHVLDEHADAHGLQSFDLAGE